MFSGFAGLIFGLGFVWLVVFVCCLCQLLVGCFCVCPWCVCGVLLLFCFGCFCVGFYGCAVSLWFCVCLLVWCLFVDWFGVYV